MRAWNKHTPTTQTTLVQFIRESRAGRKWDARPGVYGFYKPSSRCWLYIGKSSDIVGRLRRHLSGSGGLPHSDLFFSQRVNQQGNNEPFVEQQPRYIIIKFWYTRFTDVIEALAIAGLKPIRNNQVFISPPKARPAIEVKPIPLGFIVKRKKRGNGEYEKLRDLPVGKILWLEQGLWARKDKQSKIVYGISYMDSNYKRVRQTIGPLKTVARAALEAARHQARQNRW